jgi:hypothetical protein
LTHALNNIAIEGGDMAATAMGRELAEETGLGVRKV